jgi:hypothetical protein
MHYGLRKLYISTVHQLTVGCKFSKRKVRNDCYGLDSLFFKLKTLNQIMDFTIRKKRGFDDNVSRRKREEKSVQIRKDKRLDRANLQRRRVNKI